MAEKQTPQDNEEEDKKDKLESPRDENCLNSPRSGGMPAKKTRCASPAAAFMTSASPPRFVSFEQLMQAEDSVSNMTLAHEITVDNQFRLEKYEPPEKSIERQVKETMFRAFWDSLRFKLESDPPDYSQALVLLAEVKENLMNLLLPSQERIRTHIEEHIDLDLVQQQLEHDSLDLKGYASYVIDTMARLCAPIRDDMIEELKKLQDPVDLYKEIFKVLDLMKMDMANFTITQMRPYIQMQSVSYEQKKFNEFLETQRQVGVDGLEFTRRWLTTVYQDLIAKSSSAQSASGASSSGGASNIPVTPNNILTQAYISLLDWDLKEPFPETIVMDEGRILGMSETLKRLTLVCSLILITCNMGGQRLTALTDFKKRLKEHTMVILQDVSSNLFVEHTDALSDQMQKELNEALIAAHLSPLDVHRLALFRTQIAEAVRSTDPVYKLLKTRLLDFLSKAVFSMHLAPLQIPPGLSAVEQELSELGGHLLRILAHNRNVFGRYYAEIIQQLLKPDTETATAQAN